MEFLKSINSKDALEIIKNFPVSPGTENIHIDEALGRIIAQDIVSEEDIPPFSRSLVDGYAVRAADTYGAKETSPAFLFVDGHVKMGKKADIVVSEGHSVGVSTGAMIPEGADGVVMVEYIRTAGDSIEVTKGVYSGENICFKGEDIKKGDVVIKKGSRLSPFHLGVLSSIGITNFSVYRRPRAALISSGDEIVPADSTPSIGEIRDINRYTVANILKENGVDVSFIGIARDIKEDIADKILKAKGSDIILISGGSSKGERDYMVEAIEALGGKIMIHGINIKPGKPVIFGSLWDRCVFGLPGHPVSCIMVVVRFVLPLVSRLKGEGEGKEKLPVTGILTTNIPSIYGVEEYVRVSIERIDRTIYVTPNFSKTSVISSLAESDGYVVIPEEQEGLEKGEVVEVHPFY
ncbi:MAG: molybdopterin molybdotransferase MoeA [Syntrophorhabdaceae bacterium]|nr:molybdopterin molybdotransferase MoeA [Syntrophorhabdaceae bacterium]